MHYINYKLINLTRLPSFNFYEPFYTDCVLDCCVVALVVVPVNTNM